MRHIKHPSDEEVLKMLKRMIAPGAFPRFKVEEILKKAQNSTHRLDWDVLRYYIDIGVLNSDGSFARESLRLAIVEQIPDELI